MHLPSAADVWKRPASQDICWPLRNVWLGVTAEDQLRADERLPWLLQTPAAVRFVSCEPLLGEIDLGAGAGRKHGRQYHDQVGPCICDRDKRLHWVIAGGETGPGARPMHPEWVRSIRQQCAAARVPFFFKGWGEWTPYALDAFADASRPVPQRGLLAVDGTLEPAVASNVVPDTHTSTQAVVYRIGRQRMGRKLDGHEWNEYPTEGR